MKKITHLPMLRYLACVALAIYTLMAYRYGTFDFVAESLWAEDGPVFLQGALERPLSSFWTAYAGYFHFYPRMVSVIAVQFPIAYVPYLLFCGWLLAVLILARSLVRVFPEGAGYALLAFACVVVSLAQPHSGEAFLSITNTQWWFGSALAIMLAVPDAFPHMASPLALAIALTGPFSMLLLPVALYQAFKRETYACKSGTTLMNL
jgi:hypothetical protein